MNTEVTYNRMDKFYNGLCNKLNIFRADRNTAGKKITKILQFRNVDGDYG